MAKKLYGITITGKQHKWTFETYADPRYVQEWRDDGIEIAEIMNTVPMHVVNLGLVRPWCFLQDIFQLRNPFR